MKEKLRIGILLNEYSIPSWEFKILNDLRNSDFTDFAVVLKSESVQPENTKSKIGIASGILHLLGNTDRLLFKSNRDYDLKSDCSDLLRDVPVLFMRSGKPGENILGDHVDKLRALRLDIILKFGIHVLDGKIRKISKYGIWSNSVDNDSSKSRNNHGFWEVINREAVTGSSLLVLDESTGLRRVLFNSVESTCPFSMEKNRSHLFWRASLFVPRIVRSLYHSGDDFFEKQLNKFASFDVLDQSPSPEVNLKTALSAVFNYSVMAITTAIRKMVYTDAYNWQLLFEYRDNRNDLLPEFAGFRKLPSPKGIFWADPFVVAADDSYYFFVEEFLYKTDKAHISVLKLDKNGNLVGTERIIERTYHMSYPFIFKADSIYYMIPETCKSKSIELYKCETFPNKWNFAGNIMENLLAVDTTLFHYNNKWWLFSSIDQTENISGTSTELFLFFSDDFLSGDWKSHPQNPVVSDIRKARSAGKIFNHGGKIYRPSQDCSGRYGRGFKLNEIMKLTENEYSEKTVHEVEPDWDERLKGTHTFNSDRNLTVVDVYSYRKRLG